MTRTGASARPPLQEHSESFLEFVELNSRKILIGVIVVAAAAGGYALYHSSKVTRASKAEAALAGAQQAFYAGNMPLARSDLSKVTDRYQGTQAAVQASLLLAQVQFSEGKHQEGIAQLRKVQSSATKPMQASVEAMIAAGLEDQGKYEEAAAAYQNAAERAVFTNDRQNYRAEAARALMRAGKSAESLAIWKELAADEAGLNAGEARIRVGELEARAAGTAAPAKVPGG